MHQSPPLKFIIVGGGTAGWMTACILGHVWRKQAIEIELLEAEHIPTIGVGEGSTPALKTFFEQLNIPETEWMPRCNATYKCGITFKHWSTKPGFEEYYHPFASLLDNQTLPLFLANTQARLRGLDVEAHPSRFFLSAYLAAKHLAPIPHHNFPFEVHYGYHFDATLLGTFLKEKAQQMGVIHRFATVENIEVDSDGHIKSVTAEDGSNYRANFFIDCSGFKSLIAEKTLQIPFYSYRHQLFNDAAVAIPSAISHTIPSQTVATALTSGWAWRIPLANRFGNGYVYASNYCSADQAETELRAHLGLLEDATEARHLKMKVGRLQQHWHNNCLAVGLSQGFIEPLEATALFLIQQTVSLFADYFSRGGFGPALQKEFNQRINNQFDGTRDYIVTHYKTNSRNDTDYWRDNRANPDDISDSLRALFQCWMAGGDLAEEVKKRKMDRYYPVPSWYCILAGMGIFPPQARLNSPTAENNPYNMNKVDDFISRCALNYDSHRQVLDRQREKPGNPPD